MAPFPANLDYFRFVRNQPRIDAKHGESLPTSGLQGLILVVEAGIASGLLNTGLLDGSVNLDAKRSHFCR